MVSHSQIPPSVMLWGGSIVEGGVWLRETKSCTCIHVPIACSKIKIQGGPKLFASDCSVCW